MTIADKLLQVNQVKQDIKTAIEGKGVDMTGVPFTNYPLKISEISGGGGGEVDEYFYYSKAYYTITNNATLFSSAWQNMKDSETVLFDIPLSLAATNQELMEGMNVDLYVGTNGQLQALYDACVNETIPQLIYVNNVVTAYIGDFGEDVGFPAPLYMFGYDDMFLIGDFTSLGIGLGLALAKIANVSIPNNNIVIQQGFEFENENGIIIPNSVTSIDDTAFGSWTSNNQPLVIPNSVTSIGEAAFYGWSSNNQPLVIPNSVTSIGDDAFNSWTTNNQPLVIPDSVTSIGSGAFQWWKLVPYIIMEREVPPTISSTSFNYQNDAPIYVPHDSVNDYETATNWTKYASRIFSINDKP